MEIDAKEKTAPDSSVGADEGQPIQKDSNNSISNSDPKINDPASKTKESMRLTMSALEKSCGAIK